MRIVIDTGSSADILYLSAFARMGYDASLLQKMSTPVIGFTGDSLQPKGVISLRVLFGTPPRVMESLVEFLVVDAPSVYNAILGRETLNKLGAIVSPPHLKIKFPTDHETGEECGRQQAARECYLASIQGNAGSVQQVDCKGNLPSRKNKGRSNYLPPGTVVTLDPIDKAESKTCLEPTDEVDQITLSEGKSFNIGRVIQGKAREDLVAFLCANQNVFAWTAADMPGIPREITEHKLHVRPNSKPVKQKKRNMGTERRVAVRKAVLVKKSNGDWRMCIDFTDLNMACPMDPFPLPKIDQLVDSTSGHAFLSFMDAF